MSRTITALYDTRSDAEAARSRLTASNIDADNVRIVDQESTSTGTGGDSGFGTDDDSDGSSSMRSSSASSDYSTTTGSSATSGMSGDRDSTTGRSGGGFLASLKDMFLPDEDRHSYDEGMRRGGSLLYANVDEDEVDRAIAILEETGSVDMDERETSWKSEGWAGYTPGVAAATGAGYSANTNTNTDYAASTDVGANANEERIQLAEEQLVVGKREVNRGGARIRSYVVEKPVSEQVSLREEHVNVERRPVDGSNTTADTGALFQERSIEMTETAEEAVVGKTARVTEELVVSKTAEQRTETISDTVRKTEVDIDETGDNRTSTGGSMDNKGGTTDRF